MPDQLQVEIRSRIEDFVNELTELVRAAAFQSVEEAFGSTPTKPGSQRKVAKPRAAVPRKRKRSRRSSASVDKLATAIQGHVEVNPGQSVSEIAAALSSSTKDLRLPMLKLLEDKRVSTKGLKRATRYFPARAASKSKAKKKTTRKKRTKAMATR